MAQPFGIKLAVEIDQKDLVKAIKEAINKINTEGKLVGQGIKLSVDTNALTRNIKKAIQEINESNKLDSKPIYLSVSAAKLRESIKTAVSQINSSGKLDGTTVKLSAGIDLKGTAKNLQQQIAELTKQSSNVNLGTSGGNQLQTAISNVRKELEAEGERLKENNEFLRERVTLFTQSGNIATSRKYGSAGENTIINTNNGKVTSITSVTDNSKIEAEQIKATAAINKTRNALAALKAEYNDANATKPIKNTTNFAELEKEYNKIIELINEFEKADNKNTSQFKTNVESKISSFEQLIEKFQRAEYAPNTLRAKDVTTSTAIESNRLDEFIAKIKASNVPIKEMEGTIENLKQSLANITDAGSLTKFLNEFSIAKSEFNALKSQSNALSKELTQVDAVTKQITSSIKTLSSQGNQNIFIKNGSNLKVVELKKSISDLVAEYTTLQKSLKNDASAENVAKVKAEVEALQEKLRKTVADSDKLKTALSNIKLNGDISKKASTLLGQISEYQRQNSRAMNIRNPISGISYGAELEQLKDAIPNAQDLGMLDQLNNKFSIIRSNIKSLGKEGSTLINDLKTKLGKFLKWTAMTMLVTKARMYFRQLFTTVQSLDSALVDLRKTFNGSAEELNDFYFEANRLAKQMGVTTEEIIKQGAAFSRLGFSSNEAMKQMAEMSAMFAAISPDMGIEDAQDGLISIMKAFDIDPDNVLDGILSKINIIGNTAATSNGEIVEMLKRSSAAMKVANNTLEETIALELASIEVTRDAPGTGVAWRTISSRLRGLDEETLAVIEDVDILTGKIADATKTAKNPGGISIFTDASRTTYKSTYQIVKEIAEIWDDLTDKQTAELGEIMGGKRQLQTISAAVENFKAAEQALENMRKSAGSAEAEMEVIRDSAAYAMNELKETFTSLAQHSVSRGGLKNLIKFGTSALDLVDKIVSKIGLIPTILTTIIGITASKKFVNGGIFGLAPNEKTGKTGLTAFGTHVGEGWWGNVTGKTQRLEIENNIKAVQNFHSALKNGNMTMQTYNAVMKNSNAEIKRYGRAALKASDDTSVFRATTKNLNTQLKQTGTNGKLAAIGTKAAALGVQMLNTAVSMGISLLVSFALNKLIEGVSNVVNHTKILNERVKELNSEFESITSEISSLNKELADTQEKIAELEKLPKLTLLQEEELNALKAYNDELERQRKERENEARQNEIESHKTAKKLTKTTFFETGMGVGMAVPAAIDFNAAAMKTLIKNYQKLQEELNELTSGTVEYNKKQAEIEKLEKDILDFVKTLENINANLVPEDEYYEQALERTKEILQQWDEVYTHIPDTLTELLDSAQFSKTVKKLKELAETGELTAEKLENATNSEIDGIEEFREALKNVNGATFERVVESICDSLKDVKDKTNDATNSLKIFADQLDKLHDKIDGIVSKQEKLAEAFKKIGLGAKLSAEEMYELLKEVPEIAKYIQNFGKEFSISQEGFRAANAEIYKQIQDQIVQDFLEAKGQRDLINKIVELYDKQIAFVDEYGAPLRSIQDEYSELIKQYIETYKPDDPEALTKNILQTQKTVNDNYEGMRVLHQLMNDIFDEEKMIVDSINSGFETGKEKINDYNKTIQTIDKAIKTLNEDSKLSYDELNELLNIDSDLKYEGSDGNYTIAISALEDLREQSYKTRNQYIDDLLAEAEAEKASAQKVKEECQKKCGYIDEYGNYVTGTLSGIENAAEKMAAQTELGIAEAQIEALDKIINKLLGLQEDLTFDSGKENNFSEQLQNEIDYYKTIFEAVEIMRDKYTEAIDKQIDAINEVKDSLKEENEERQRALDLAEALTNLENAKKRKVWVYSDDGGFKQVQDVGAVKEAAEKYRDVITDIQEAELDAQVKELEKQKEQLEKSVKDLTDYEKNLQDAIKVEQAKTALGLADEKDLLNLSDAVRDGVKEGFADAFVTKENEDNKDKTDRNGNSLYTPVTAEDVLKSLGATFTSDDIKAISSSLPKLAEYVAAKNTASDIRRETDDARDRIVYNTGNTINATYNINDVKDPEAIADTIDRHLVNLFTKVENSIK